MAIEDRLFTRGSEGRTPRWYCDLRDLNAGQKACIPEGSRRATTERRIALPIAKRLLREALDEQEDRAKGGPREVRTLEEFSEAHVDAKEEAGKVTESTIARYRHSLDVACRFFGSTRRLDSITPQDVAAYVRWLTERPNGRGGTLTPSTQRRYLAELSNCFRRAVFEQAVSSNPVSGLIPEVRPQVERTEADHLDAHEVALLLEAAKLRTPKTTEACPHLYAILGAFALTGGRKSEVLGLRVSDVSFDRKVIRIEGNQHRRLKTSGSTRSVPLWPQLRGILRRYLFGRDEVSSDLLFPNAKGGMIRDLRKQLDSVGKLASFEEGRIRTRIFRHSFAVARIQTLDGGEPVSLYTVARELGHSNTKMLEQTYAHLGDVRHRSEVVEYRVEDFEDRLGERLEAVRAAS